MGKVVKVLSNVKFDGWSKLVTVALLEDGSYATNEFPCVVKAGDMVRLVERKGKRYADVPCFIVLSD